MIRDWLPAVLMLVVYKQAGEFFVRVDREFQERLLQIDSLILAPLLRWLSILRIGKFVVMCLELAYLLCYR